MNEKETILSVLQEIRDLLKIEKKTISETKSEYITFPIKTAREIVTECNNSVAGGKLLYSTSWYESEDFYTKETCRPRTVKIPTEILHAGKSWNECKELIGEENMFNFAEIVYMLRESEEFRKLLSSSNPVCYTWTSSRASDGGLVRVGGFDSDGSNVNEWEPGYSVSRVGVCLKQ